MQSSVFFSYVSSVVPVVGACKVFRIVSTAAVMTATTSTLFFISVALLSGISPHLAGS